MRSSQQQRVSHATYRPDIDGLRAVAVLLVIGFHAFPQWVRGGFIGVDVFFVISGFLITGILLDDLKSGTFSFSRFYARRIRRIFPALIVVLIACLALGWWLLLPDEFSSLGRNIAGGAAFASNFTVIHETGYFDVEAARKPLLHLWSLGIEEQFYLVWPLVLLIAFRVGGNAIGWLIAAILAASFLANVATVGSSPAATFYWPFTRAWELMAGSILAWLAVSGTMSARTGWADTRAALGITLIVAAVALIGKSSEFPGWWALLPTLGTALVVSAEKAWINRKILANPALVFVGLISYPLYLWHWPLLSFQTIANPDGQAVLPRATLIATSFALAWLTYVAIERPVRFCKIPAVPYLGATMVAAGLSGLVVVHYDGFADRMPAAIRTLAPIAVDEVAWRTEKCLLERTYKHFASECSGDGRRPSVFLWGDSYAASLYPGLKALQTSENFGLAQYTIAGCPPVPDFPVEGRPFCAATNDVVIAIIRSAKPDVILLYSTWNYPGFDPDKLDATVNALRGLPKSRIVLMGPPPMWANGLPQAMLEEYRAHRLAGSALPERTLLHLAAGIPGLDKALSAKAAALGVEYISVWDVLCNPSGCLTRIGDDLTSLDYGHLTIPGAEYLAAKIMPVLFPDR